MESQMERSGFKAKGVIDGDIEITRDDGEHEWAKGEKLNLGASGFAILLIMGQVMRFP